MKILLIGHEQDLNGASKSLLNIISVLEQEHDVFVLTSYADGAFPEALKHTKATVITKPYYRWCLASWTWKGWVKRKALWYLHHQFVNERTAKELAAFCLEQGIDVIHTNTSVLNIGALIHKYSGIPHVWHIREFADLDFDMHPLINEDRYYETMNRYCNRFICISQAIYNHYDRLQPAKKQVIYNGVDKKNILPEKNQSPITRLLIAGRISKAKGQWDAICACEKLLSRGVTDFVLNIAGTGELPYPVPKSVAEHIHFLGQVKDMPALRKEIDVELVCSTAEAFGRVTAEAMLGGIPVVGSNSGGTTELIQDGVCGFLYPPGDVEALADKLELLIKDPGMRTRMGRSAQEYACSHFMIERCVSEILEIYEQVTSAPV